MLTLINFGKQVNDSILKRGKEYYENGFVVSLEETDDNSWTAEVEGSETYTVEITLNKRYEISDYSCDCPYDNVTCKHVIAVLFRLRDEIAMAKLQPEKPLKKQVFDNLLKSLTIKEYQDFTRSYAADNKDFKTKFELFFADKDGRINVQEKYTELVQKIIRKYSRSGYIDYSSSIRLSKEVNRLIKTGADYISKNNFRDALALVIAILRPLMDVMSNSDDSSGNIGDCVENVINLLETIATTDTGAIDIKDQVFAFLQAEVNNKDYFSYGDFGYYLFEIFRDLAIRLGKSGIILECIDSWTSKLADQNDSDLKEYLQKVRITVLKQSGKIVEAEKLLQQNMDIVSLRADVVSKAIGKKDFPTAKKLIAEGIKIAEGRKHPGTVALWQKELLRIAMLEKDTQTVRQYTKYFAFDGGFSAEYYNQWKATFSKTEWQGEIEKHITETIEKITKEWDGNRSKYWRPAHPPLLQRLAPVFIQESFMDRLLALLQQAKALSTTLEYHPYLLKKYPNELLALYLPALEMAGIKSNSRSEYARLVYQMKSIIKDIPAGKEKILDIAKRLKEKFSRKPHRPAMIEELNKILK